MAGSCVSISKDVVAVETGEPQQPQPALNILVSTVPGSMVWKHSLRLKESTSYGDLSGLATECYGNGCAERRSKTDLSKLNSDQPTFSHWTWGDHHTAREAPL